MYNGYEEIVRLLSNKILKRIAFYKVSVAQMKIILQSLMIIVYEIMRMIVKIYLVACCYQQNNLQLL